jgi:hypothetical protein
MDKQQLFNQYIASMINRILTLLNHLLHKINRITLDIMRLEKEKQ